MQPAYLILANGQIFEGESFGATGNVVGEVVFTTGMTGYIETLTDPSFYGQIIVQTFPLIGNYGVISEDFESSHVHCGGYIVKHLCEAPSNFRSEGDLHSFLSERGIVGLCGIDTRQLTRVIRESGVMNGIITTDKEKGLAKIAEVKEYRIKNAVDSVSRKDKLQTSEGEFKVALLDFGLKLNIVRELERRGAAVTILPHDASPADVLAENPDGIMLSNGPGDPAENTDVIKNVAELCKHGIPIFGICLGHQILALAHGFKTEKLKYGHRGANHPAKDLTTGKIYITSQNHGYAVRSDSVDPEKADKWFVNANDGTNEGLIYKGAPIFSVQFHPEACCGPLDTNFLFDTFVDCVRNSI